MVFSAQAIDFIYRAGQSHFIDATNNDIGSLVPKPSNQREGAKRMSRAIVHSPFELMGGTTRKCEIVLALHFQ